MQREDKRSASICFVAVRAIDRNRVDPALALDEPAASTPITRPDLSSSGPPESPGTRRALVATAFVSCATSPSS